MSNKNPYEKLFELILTTSQLNECVNAIQHAVDASFDAKKDTMTVLDSYMPYHVTNAILDISEDEKINLRDASIAADFLKKILGTLKSAYVVDITLAFHPTYEQLQKIVVWWRKEVNPHVILNLKVDPKLIAGAVIGYGGAISDLTIKQDLSSFLNES